MVSRFSDLYERGNAYKEIWIAYIIFGVIGIVANSCVLYLFSRVSESRRPTSFVLIRVINFSDLIFSAVVLGFNAANFYNKSIWNDNECVAQAIMLELFFILSGSIHAVIAYAMYQNVCHGVKCEFQFLLKWVIVAVCFATSCSLLSIYLPLTGYSPLESGTWCITRINNPLAFVILMGLGCGVPPVLMGVFYYQVYHNIMEGRRLLEDEGMTNVRVKAGVINEVKKLLSFVFSFYFAAMPFMAVPLYHWVTFKDAHPLLDVVTAPAAVFLLAVVDPCLFIYLNGPVRELFMERVGVVSSCLRVCCRLGQPKDVSIQAAAAAAGSEKKDTDPECNLDLDCWKTWADDKTLVNLFISWSEKNFVSENIMFICAVKDYQLKGQRVMQHLRGLKAGARASAVNVFETITEGDGTQNSVSLVARVSGTSTKLTGGTGTGSLFSTPENEPVSDEQMSPTEVEEEAMRITLTAEEWDAFRSLAAHIIEVFVRTPTAPLEVNIPDSCRKGIFQALRISDASSKLSFKRPTNHPSPGLHSSSDEILPLPSNKSQSQRASQRGGGGPIMSLKKQPSYLGDSVSRGIVRQSSYASKKSSHSYSRSNHRRRSFSESLNLDCSLDVLEELICDPMTREEHMDIMMGSTTAFDCASTIIGAVIASDIFPRFRKSEAFASGVALVTSGDYLKGITQGSSSV